MPDQYYQCRLGRRGAEKIGWIEERGARPGLEVELLPSRDLWEILEVYTHGLPLDVIKDMEANYRAGMPSTRDTDKDKRKKAMG